MQSQITHYKITISVHRKVELKNSPIMKLQEKDFFEFCKFMSKSRGIFYSLIISVLYVHL